MVSEYSIIFLSLIITFFELISSKGWNFNKLAIFLSAILIAFMSAILLKRKNNELRKDDIVFKISFRTPNKSISEILEESPKEIETSLIKINNAKTSGTFKRETIDKGKGKSFDLSRFIDYTCLIELNKGVDFFPKDITELKEPNISIEIFLKKLLDKGYYLNGAPRIIIRGKSHWGNIDLENNKIYFP